MFTTYAIGNLESGKIYIGQTSNLEARLKRHNGILRNKISSYTSKQAGTWVLIHKEIFDSRALAIQREKQLKSYQGRQFIKNIWNNLRA